MRLISLAASIAAFGAGVFVSQFDSRAAIAGSEQTTQPLTSLTIYSTSGRPSIELAGASGDSGPTISMLGNDGSKRIAMEVGRSDCSAITIFDDQGIEKIALEIKKDGSALLLFPPKHSDAKGWAPATIGTIPRSGGGYDGVLSIRNGAGEKLLEASGHNGR